MSPVFSTWVSCVQYWEFYNSFPHKHIPLVSLVCSPRYLLRSPEDLMFTLGVLYILREKVYCIFMRERRA